MATTSKSAASPKPITGEINSAMPTSDALCQLIPLNAEPCSSQAFIMPTPMIEPISEWELEAGRPRYQVAKFQMIAAPSSESTIASPRPVLMLTSRSTGRRWTMLNATPIPPAWTPMKFQRPDQTTAGVGFRLLV